MRAAILDAFGATPRVGEFPDPGPADGAVVVDVLAAGLNPVELAIASGRFYGSPPPLPSVVGREAVARDAEGTRAYFVGCVAPFGTMAERALVERERLIGLPDEIDDGVAVALGTAGLAAWMPLTRVAQPGEDDAVLVLGASGAVGQIAVQAARVRGAGRVVAAARSEAGRRRALELGADAAVGLAPDELAAGADGGYDVVLDLLYGEPLLAALGSLAPSARVVQVGNAAGPEITLPAAALRSRAATITGYTTGRVAPSEVRDGYLELVGEAIAGRIVVDVERVALDAIGEAWERQARGPHRKLVVVP
jgi:NADPH:quinone reductase-like Zn-dependent oxidoreductase